MSLPALIRSSVAALAALVAGGCALKPSGPAHGYYAVTSPTAEFYKYGPAQSFGPDLVLKKGERLTMLERQWGFSRVLTANGVAGYVASEDIDPIIVSATPVRTASRRSGPVPIGKPGQMSSSRRSRIQSEITGDPGDPLFNVNDVPLPLPDDVPVSGGERPQFRTTRQTPGEEKPAQKPKFR